MMFLYIAVVFLSLYGIIGIIGSIRRRFYRVKKSHIKQLLLLAVDGNAPDTELEVHLCLARLAWADYESFDGVFAVDCGIPSEIRGRVKQLFKDKDIDLINQREVDGIFCNDGKRD